MEGTGLGPDLAAALASSEPQPPAASCSVTEEPPEGWEADGELEARVQMLEKVNEALVAENLGLAAQVRLQCTSGMGPGGP